MKVSELIEILANMPQDAEVNYLWDGGIRGDFEAIWLARNGRVVCGDRGEYVYDSDARPASASGKEDRYWQIKS